jgi:hypothetical protein
MIDTNPIINEIDYILAFPEGIVKRGIMIIKW